MASNNSNPETIFSQAIELPVDQRPPFVLKASGEDTELAAEVNQLLVYHQKNQESGFIIDEIPNLGVETNPSLAEIAESVGDTIGRYKLLEKIGEGGMGVVYMAEQTEGVRRRVALKIIKLGMDTRQVVARFEAERQAMALFDHPNITRVFDAGSTNSGRPYFVMELVRGTNIVKFAHENRLPVAARLKLIVDVCHAVQHAHQKGIIHRDLKPTNILVTLFDGVPVPKVIDFGIAKAIGHQTLTDKTLFTRYSAMLGTPQYMSPEQAELNGMDVDTRSDIYSLGVLIYELLTGSTPIPKEQLKQINILALHETLRDAEIETPSTRVSKIERTTNGKMGKSASPANERLGGDLDWVVMKALSRDRSQRYASANELAADVGRYLDGEAVLAVPPSKIYQLRSYFNRHAKMILTSAIAATLLLIASVTCLMLAINAQGAKVRLAESNQLLTANVKELEFAKKQIKESASAQLFDSAISVAFVRFEMDFQPKIFDLACELFPDTMKDTPELMIAADVPEALDGEANVSIEPMSLAFNICLDYQRENLIDLPFSELIKTSSARIQRHFENEEKFFDQIYGIENPLGQSEEHEHSKECLLVRSKANEILAKDRHHFFRHLVNEYRRSFGDKDPRVAEALNLLASCLIADENYDEADARLQEATAIADEIECAVAKKLMGHLQRMQATESRARPRENR